ncbi:MAG: ATP-binding protein, partial [Chlamydiae bacterium]|nr:ATP-binding protein [Chlamydiota bacterium]
MHTRPIFKQLVQRLQEPRKFIQVLLGPRQVGKTTLALQSAKAVEKPCHYISADLASFQDLAWLKQQWEVSRLQAGLEKGALLIIDEVQKIPHWSDMIKSLWDEDTRNGLNLSVLILKSSPWLIQKEMTESLAGRFEMIPITHWTYSEMQESFGSTLDEYLYFGGYPGAAPLANKEDPTRWSNYINDSLIEMTISRDILLMTQINKPVLLRRLFQLGSMYSGQILSYSKILGELQDAGNTTTLAHYLDLLAGAGLLIGLQKFAMQPVRQKGSSPKFMTYNTALMTAQSAKSFTQAQEDPIFWGHLVESAVGAHLLNSIRGTQIELFYWREGDKEVDFVLRKGESILAVEVKSNRESLKNTGMDLFLHTYKTARCLLVGKGGLPLEE